MGARRSPAPIASEAAIHPPRRTSASLGGALVAATLLVAGLVPALVPSAAAAAADLAPPATITVCLDDGPVTVDFDEYVKWVVPYEYGNEGPDEYIKAGAVAVKSFAWYYLEHPWSAECQITGDGRHQHFVPGNDRRNARTDALVDATWGLRLEEDGRPAFAQYCSRSCGSFTPGRHLNQFEAIEQAAGGMGHAEILARHYSGLSRFALVDWTAGLGLRWRGNPPYPFGPDDGPVLRLTVDGVDGGDPRAEASLFATCDLGDGRTTYEVAAVPVTDDGNGRALAEFDATGALDDCVHHEVDVLVHLRVNRWLVASASAEAWRPWTSAAPRDVARLGDADEAIAAAIAISRTTFPDADAPPSEDDEGGLAATLLPEEEEEPTAGAPPAETVVLTRSDKFPDALAAAGLAGDRAPILLNPGGPDAGLHADVRAEINRVLAGPGTVHLIGGPEALSPEVEADLEADGHTVRRHGGEDRVATALLVADAVIAERPSATVLVARAFPDTTAGWADAIASGSFAAAMRHPILLTRPSALDPEVEQWIEDPAHAIDEAVLLGGPRAIAATAEAALDEVDVTRVAGAERDDTAAAIAQQLWDRPDAPPVRAALLIDIYDTGSWPFALAAAVYGAKAGAPQLGVRSLVPRHSTGKWLDAHEGLPALVVGGGTIVAERILRDSAG